MSGIARPGESESGNNTKVIMGPMASEIWTLIDGGIGEAE